MQVLSQKALMLLFSIILSIWSDSCQCNTISETEANSVLQTGDSISYTQIGRVVHERLLIETDIDMHGCVCKIPQGVLLCAKGGVIRNGTIVGSNTRIVGKRLLFDKVKLRGCWNVPYISSKMFTDLSYVNALRDVLALANPDVQNKIVIEKGNYWVKAVKNADVCLPICSNTTFILKGNIRLKPNSYKNYYIVRARGNNIHIRGNGTLNGDKPSHTGTAGEWGMGVDFKGSINSTIEGLTIQDCWGDCIYVGGCSKNVLIENCKLNNGRRQGISITSADGVTIRNCMITNISGTDPQYAIDIEPNRRDSVDNIVIEKVVVTGCEGGIAVSRSLQKKGLKTPWIGRVSIKDCKIMCESKLPIMISRCEKIIVKKCHINWTNGKKAMIFFEVGEAVVEDNKLRPNRNILESLSQKALELMGLNDGMFIKMTSVEKTIERNNTVLKENSYDF